ncbi:hypothetical protein PSPO_a2411 [Pseudoalteromonas spongiae UST010723-006]|nr:hypothetical protein PSPO_a2411 [Pseudoalteromonas spongiae UST010723-006]
MNADNSTSSTLKFCKHLFGHSKRRLKHLTWERVRSDGN